MLYRACKSFLCSTGNPVLTLILLSIALTAIVAHSGGRGRDDSARLLTSGRTALARQLSGTDEMAEFLRMAAIAADPRDLPYLLNARRAELIRRAMVLAQRLPEQRRLHLDYASELTKAGRAEDAIRELEALETDLRLSSPSQEAEQMRSIRTALAIAHLRLGEDQNCCARNTPQSCLLPIRGTGVHSRPYGSSRAISILEGLLREDPSDLRARWLLNIAFMTLGRYPQDVPARWRIETSAFRSDHPLPRFANVAPLTGLAKLGRAGGTVVDDFDGDDRLDILQSSIAFDEPLTYFRNTGDGSFTGAGQEAGLARLTGGANMVQADFDNDGRTDVFVMRGGSFGKAGELPSSLLRNVGGGRFEDVTRRSGLFRIAPTRAACWLDYDADGHLDLFVGYESSAARRHACALFRNNGDGTFNDVALRAGVAQVGAVRGAVSADYDGDRRPDLYLTMGDSASSVLYRNAGGGRFTDETASAGLRDSGFGSAALFFDFDNDGRPDLFRMNARVDGVADVAADYLELPTAAARSQLFHNLGNGTFEDVSRQSGLHRVMPGAGVHCGDLDNDGFLDLYVATGTPSLDMIVPNRMFRNDGRGRFQEVTTAGDFGHLQKGQGVAFADLNNDGSQDVFAHLGGAFSGDMAYSALFANPGARGRWITLQLAGTRENRSAIGATIRVEVRTPKGLRRLHRTVSSGGSFGAGPLRREIGLGEATAIERIEILWPSSGRKQVLHGLRPGGFYRVTEGSVLARSFEPRKFHWPSAKP
jgi:hypothetical protein